MLRLALARALSDAGRCDDALSETRAGLAESQDQDLVADFRCLAAEILQQSGQSAAALKEWLEVATLATGKTPYAALAALRLLAGASAKKILGQLDRGTFGRFDQATADAAAPLPERLLGLRLHRLWDDSGALENLARELISADGLDDELRSMLAVDLAALGLTADALRILPETEAPRTVAVRARLLVEAGDYATVRSFALPADPVACRSILVSQALAHLAAGEHDAAADCIARCPDGDDAEPHLATVLLALAKNDYDGAKSALNVAATITADSLDTRLLRAQIRLECGEIDDIRRGRKLLERLAAPAEKATAREPEWMRLQRAVRSHDERFVFALTEWAFLRHAPDAIDLLSNAEHLLTTFPQDAEMATHLAELLADQGDTQAACEALDRSVSAWLNASAYHEASQVAARARDLDEARGWAALRRVLVSEARALLWDVANRDATSALAKAKQAWQLQQDEEAATLWAEAATIVSYENPADGEPYGGIDELTSALDAVGTLPLTATTAGYRGFVRLRLSQVASSARRGHARSSVAWLVISVLLDPRQRAWWEQLVWALGQVDARMCALEVARRQLRLAEKEPEALWVMLAATLNQYGTPAAIAPVLSQFQNEDGRSPGDWASALATAQLQAATLAAQLDALPGLISQPPLPDDVLWSVATRAEARALIEAPEWQDALRMAAASEAQALDYGLAARHNLLLGEFDEAVRQCDLAQEVDAGEEAVDVVRQFVRLMGEDPSAEPRLAHYLGRLKCPAQLLSYVNVDLPIMARTARPGWPAAALSRLRQQALARLDVLEKEPVAVPESELRELDESGVLWMLFRLLLIDDDADVSWSFRRRAVEDLEAALSSPVVAASPQDWSGPDLTSVVSQVAGAFLERAARLCLTEVQLLPENEDARGVLAATRELAAALADSDSRREAMAIGALLVAVTDRTSLAQAVSGSGLDEDLSPRQLAGIWSTHVPDAGSWWRLRDVLAATLPGDELAAVEPSLLGRLSQLCGLTEPEQAAERPLQGVLLGSSLVPDDSSEQWVLFTQYVPAMKQRIEERTGCYIPGFRMRFDPVRADAVTYLLNGTVTDFVRLPPDAQARTSPRLDGSSDELGPGQVARSAEIVTSLLQEGAVRHLDLLYGPPDVLRLASAVHVSLSNPAELVYWLDAVRGAIAARCRLPGDEQLATLIRKGWESSLPAEQLTEALRADLPSWSDPAEKDQP